MSDNPTNAAANTTTTAGLRVTIEAVAWITKFVGGDGTERISFVETARPGDSVRTVLKKLSGKYPQLKDALWDPDNPREIGEHVEIIVNDAFLGVDHTLDSEVKDGDRISLIGQYMGG